MSDPQYRLVYFNIRGLAEPIRWMLQIRNVNFIDERIDLEDLDGGEAQYCPLPILYIDEEVELTQTHSVMRYVAKQLGFNGHDEMEAARASEVSELIYDLRVIAVELMDSFNPGYGPDIVPHTIFRKFSNEACLTKKLIMRKRLQQMLPVCLDKFAKMLEESNGEYLTGVHMTYADLALVNFLSICEDNVNPRILDNYPKLKELQREIFQLIDRSRLEQDNETIYASPA